MILESYRRLGPNDHRARRHQGKLLVGAGLGALALLGACADAPPGDRVADAPAVLASPSPPPKPSPGQLEMIALLDRVAEEARRDDPFFGRNQPEEVRAELEALPAGVPDLRRWLFHKVVARHELRIGNTESGVEHALEAYRQLAVFPHEIPPQEAIETVFQVGVAYLRLGELRNCARHHTSESCILPIRGGGVHVEQGPSTAAVGYFTEVLERAPEPWWQIKARWLLNLAYMTLGRYPDGVPDAWRIPPEVFASDEPFPRFPEIASDLGLATFDLAGGAVVDDLDGDGLLDLVVSTSDPAGPMHLYWSRGDGSFVDGTRAAGLAEMRGGLNLVQADYDGDGDLDLFVARGAWLRSYGRHPNSLLRNNGDRSFTDVTFEAGLGEVHYPTQAAAWADYDLDGDLDLYVGNEQDQRVVAPGQLFRNNGDGTFTDVASRAGVTNDRYAKAVSWGDYDQDRDPDLYVSNLGERNRLYRNNGDGTFTDVAMTAGVERPIASFPAWFWDFDNDGSLDLFVAGYGGPNLPPDVGFVAASWLGLPTQAEHARLYKGDGKGGFAEVGQAWGLERITHPMGANFGDLDNDGWLDFYLGTGYPYYEGLMPNVMYRNRDGLGFADVTTAGGFGHLQKGHAIAFADLDHDGDQDVFAQMGGMYPGDGFSNALFENPGFGNRWIKLRLLGTRSNRFGLGARIRIVVREGQQTREIHRVVSSGGSFGSNPLRLEVGLGRAEAIERLEVHWPRSDTRQLFRDVPVDRLVEIVEGQEELRVKPVQATPFRRAHR